MKKVVISTILGTLLLLSIITVVPIGDQKSYATALGSNGKIAFTSTRNGNNEIYVMNADGTGQD
jgi:hypothetical protein